MGILTPRNSSVHAANIGCTRLAHTGGNTHTCPAVASKLPEPQRVAGEIIVADVALFLQADITAPVTNFAKYRVRPENGYGKSQCQILPLDTIPERVLENTVALHRPVQRLTNLSLLPRLKM